MSDKRYQVVIVGGGPVGVGLAIELGLRNISCALVERYPTPQLIPKGQNLTQRTLEHFYFWGIEDEIRAARAMPADYPIGGITAYGNLMSRYWFPWMKRELVRPFYFTDNERLPQYATEGVLRQKLTTLPLVDSFFGWTAETVWQTEQGVRVTSVKRNGDRQLTLEADFVIGCDGSHSLVRQQAGIEQIQTDHDKRMVLLVFRSRELHEHLQRFPGKSFYKVLHPALDGYWRFFGRVDVGESWFFHCPVPSDTTPDNMDFRALLYEAAGIEFVCEFDHIGFWDLRFAVAERYSKGRIFLAGDASHSHPPYGGYGINVGFEDARNLGWKLAAYLQGWGGQPLLNSYSDERRPIFASLSREFIQASIEQDRALLAHYNPAIDQVAFEQAWAEEQMNSRSDVRAYEPHYEGSPIVCGPDGAVSSARGWHEQGAQAGHHLTPQVLSSGKNVYEELGSGFTLLALSASDEAVAAFAEAAETLAVPLKVIEDDGADGRSQYQARFILVRPDQYVAWVGNELTDDVQAILGKAAGL